MKIRKEFKIGLFVIIILAATFVVINILRGIDILGREIKIYGQCDDAGMLVASAPLQIRGYTAGRVNSVEYDEKLDKFVIECSVDKRFRIPADSRIVLYSTSIMGGKAVRIDYGVSTEYAADGAVLGVEAETDMLAGLSGGIGKIVSKVESLADSIQVTVSDVNALLSDKNRDSIESSLEHLNSTLASARNLSSAIEGKSGQLQEIITNLQLLSEKFTPIADSVGSSLDNVSGITSKINDSDIEGTVANINDAILKINGAVDNLTGPLDSLLNNADSLIKAIQKDPKKYIKVTIF